MLNNFALFFCSVFFLSSSFIIAKYDDNKDADTLKKYLLPNITIISERNRTNILARPISQITQSQISQTYSTNDLPLVISELPSIFSYSQNGNGIGYSTLSLRGFDQRRIAVNINGIPQNDPEDHNVYWIDFPDITSNLELIEVQRGAGHNNFGFASIGGSINLITSNFVNQKGVMLFSGFGFQEFSAFNQLKHNITKSSIVASSGLIPTNDQDVYYSIYSRFSQINSFGYRNHSFAELNSYFFGFARFDNNFSTQINIFGGPIRDGLAYYGIPKAFVYDKEKRLLNFNYWAYDSSGSNVSFAQLRRKQEIEEFSQPHFELLNDLKFNDNLMFKSALFYYTGKGFFDYDGTGWTDANSFELNEKNGYPNAQDPQNPIIRAFVDNRQIGWIPSFTFDNSIQFLKIGAELRYHFSEHWGKINYADNLPDNYNPDFMFYYYNGSRFISSISASYQRFFAHNFALNFDAQIIYHNYSISNDKAGNFFRTFRTSKGIISAQGKLFDINYLFLNPRIGINYQFNSSNSIFGFAAITSREPRMANLYNASEAFSGKSPRFYSTLDNNNNIIYDFSRPLVKPEQLYDFELGYNYNNYGISFSSNLYYMLFTNELVKSGQIDVFGDPIDGNAPSTVHYGLEFVIKYLYQISSNQSISITGNTTFSQNKIIDYPFELGNGNQINLKNNDIAGFPSILGNLRLSYTFSNLYLSILYQYVGPYKTDNFGDMLIQNQNIKDYLGWDYYSDNSLDAYGIFNFDLVYSINNLYFFNKIKFQLKINNLLNKLYAAGAEGKEFFPGAERNVFLGLSIEF